MTNLLLAVAACRQLVVQAAVNRGRVKPVERAGL